MRAAVSVSLVCGCIFASAAAEPPKEVFEFIQPILEHELTTAQDAWENRGYGGYVFRFNLDVTGDGKPDMFLGSTLYFQRGHGIWRPYLATSDGGYRPFDYDFSETSRAGPNLSATELWVQNDNGPQSILTFGRDRRTWFSGRSVFRNGRMTYEGGETTEEAVEQMKAAPNVKLIIPEVWGVLLFDLLRNPDAEWKRIDFDSAAPDPNGYFIAAADAERVKGLSNFTPDLALRWLATAAAGKTPVDESAVPAPRLPPMPWQTPDAAPATVAASSSPQARAAIVERKTPGWPWLVGIAALLVVATLALKRRA